MDPPMDAGPMDNSTVPFMTVDEMNYLVEQALKEQAENTTYTLASVSGVGSLVLHVLILALLGDRLLKLTHKPTIRAFIVTVTFDMLCSVWNCLGNSPDPNLSWFFSVSGTNVYFYFGGFFAAATDASLSYLTYLRIGASVRTQYGARADYALTTIVCLVLPLEVAKHWYAAVSYTIGEDWSLPLYNRELVIFALAYRTLLDVLLCSYSVWVVHQAATTSHSATSPAGRLMREDKALFTAYSLRVFLFLGIDVVWATAQLAAPDDGDIRFAALALWSINRTVMPWKPYLLITDIGRVRALSEDGSGVNGGVAGSGGSTVVAKGDYATVASKAVSAMSDNA
ncbi:hypothetical protein DFJ77DRAFT_473603 [Powellomyces hirtus]|nr:hypothetical protein DFJ77DRAFT_473603 [Powellomyces hirtus]